MKILKIFAGGELFSPLMGGGGNKKVFPPRGPNNGGKNIPFFPPRGPDNGGKIIFKILFSPHNGGKKHP